MAKKSPARNFRSDLFPYEACFATVNVAEQIAEMSYVDTGPLEAEPVVLLHGNPTWSFLYRNIIALLEKQKIRTIAPDFLGFGRSDKLDRYTDYTLTNHLSSLTQFVEKLKLEKFTLVVQDWGGPIGLSYAVANPERISRLVIMNTWAFAPKTHNRVPQPLKTFRMRPLGEVLVLGFNMFVNMILPLGTAHFQHMRDEVMRAYRAPFPFWRSRWPVLAFPRHIPLSPDDAAYEQMKQTDEGLHTLQQPVKIIWGEKDPVFPPRVIEKFRERLTNIVAEKIFSDASHFLQEDKPHEIAHEIASFVSLQ